MCGRFSITQSLEVISQRFAIQNIDLQLIPRYNAAPMQLLPVITASGTTRCLQLFRWGLIPSWSKDTKAAIKMINARAETITEKPSFRKAFASQRCLVPADSFYEWKEHTAGKLPIRFMLKTQEVFAFAGIWESWESPQGETVKTFSIITVPANELVTPIHDRMPAILLGDQEEDWLKSGKLDPTKFLLPYPAQKMYSYEVSPKLNYIKNDTSSLIQPYKPISE